MNKQKVDAVATVEITAKNEVGNTTSSDTDELVSSKIFDSTPAIVIFKQGQTINKGNFNSIRMDVGIHIPCLPSDVDATFEAASEWVEERLKQAAQQGHELWKSLSKNTQHPF